MDETTAKWLSFNYDNKYSKGHKCSENTLFYIDYEDEEDKEVETSQDLELEETTPKIYCHTLDDMCTPETHNI